MSADQSRGTERRCNGTERDSRLLLSMTNVCFDLRSHVMHVMHVMHDKDKDMNARKPMIARSSLASCLSSSAWEQMSEIRPDSACDGLILLNNTTRTDTDIKRVMLFYTMFVSSSSSSSNNPSVLYLASSMNGCLNNANF